MTVRWLFFVILALVIFSGCSIQNQLLKDLNEFEQPLYYVHDSDIQNEKINIAVHSDSIIFEDSLTYRADVTCDKRFFPIFFWKYDYTCKLGKKNFEEDLSSFVYNSFIKESYRSGKYVANPDSFEYNIFKNDYNILIIVKDIVVSGPYQYLGSHDYHLEVAGPAIAKCVMKIILKQQDNVIFENSIESEKETIFLKRRKERSFYDFREKYSIAMTEALSETLKDCIAQIVSYLNSYIDNYEQNLEVVQVISLEDISDCIENTFIDDKLIEVSPEHVIVITNDYEEFEGKIIKIDKKNVSLDFYNTLIIIRNKNIIKILDHMRNDVTEREFARSDFKRINYNSYHEIKEIR